eukprot:CAMPEP_0181027084 /NCGR_PEP_ID=MMETSP1070-20121207/3981_1 /TAXON_ID=265543 /ORGANISM="Minutocellus polymorphus, Strain NH13" /LENGTH=725 /DNA_ID=CAMNT_0023104313 /DNA_START=174 /DNA_END=2355 /DNA_ORIENTATION=+
MTRDAFGRHRRLAPDCLIGTNPLDVADKALLAEYRIESNLAETTIDKKFTDETGLDRSVLLNEIRDAASKQPQGVDTAEIGPSGRFKYFHIDDGAGIRMFYRVPVSSGTPTEAGEPEEYLRVSFHTEMSGPTSLSVDEMFIARVASPTLGGTDKIIVRHIESGNEHSIAIPNLESLAFGPNIKDIFILQQIGSAGLIQCIVRIAFHPVDGFDAPENSDILLHDADERNFVEVRRTKGNRWIMMQSTSKSSNEAYLVDGDGTLLVRKREENVMYFVDCGDADDEIFLLAHKTNNDEEKVESDCLGEEMKLFTARSTDLPLGSFRDAKMLYKPDENHSIQDIDVFSGFVLLYETSTQDGKQRISICREDGAASTCTVSLPEQIHECVQISLGQNGFFNSSSFRFYVESPLRPPTPLEYDVEMGTYCEGNRVDNFNDEDYFMKKVFATSADGTAIPMTLASQTTPGIEGQRPTVLVAYGSYGEMNGPVYDPALVPLLRRNFTIAHAHTRGGGELGTKWYEGGRGMNKPRAIDDLIACAEALTNELAVTETHLLGVKAFSAGAVVAAGAANRSPSLFSALSLTCPFLDVTGAMSDSTLPLTEHERDEWGDPYTIAEYCPFTNVVGNSLPPTLVVGALDDVNVPYWHASTYAMKRKQMLIQMREDEVDDQRHLGETLLKIEESGGHNLIGFRLNVSSLDCAFLISELKTKSNKEKDGKVSMLGMLWNTVV